MSFGLTDDQRALERSLCDWAEQAGTPALVRAAEQDGPAAYAGLAPQLASLGVAAIALPESLGGGGGTFLDLACALEACARGLVPGPLLPTAVAVTVLAEAGDAEPVLREIADGAVTVAVALRLADLREADGLLHGEAAVLCGAGAASHLLVGRADGDRQRWFLVPADAEGVSVRGGGAVDLSRPVGSVRLSGVPLAAVSEHPLDLARVRAVAAALAAAEASGVARWAMETAVAYAGVREQFGRVIGSFQVVKHLCAQMLEAAESATAVAWDAAAAYDDGPEQLTLAAAVAGSVALDAAVGNAQDCIQVLGGIGFTWEHDAHLYLRRALADRLLLGGADGWRLELAAHALGGLRRTARVDLDGRGEGMRARVHADLQRIAALPAGEQRSALAEAGLLMPHWPPPYGLGADPVDQLVIDQECLAAGIRRPDLGIGAWAAPTVLQHGDDAQRDRFVTATLRGDISWCQLFSEPGAGSDLASLRTKAARVDGGWRLTGQKVWTSLAAQADWAICLARTDPDAPKHQGISYFLLDMTAEGIEIRPLREITGDSLFNEVYLDGAFVPDACVVGEVDGGWRLARTTLANERVAISGSSLGTSVEQALVTAAQAEQVTEAVRLRLGAAVADAATVKALGLRSTLRSLVGAGPGPESSVQKLVGVRQRQDSAQLALDLLGERALADDAAAAEVLREALSTRCLSIAGGTTQVLRNVAAERILGLPRE